MPRVEPHLLGAWRAFWTLHRGREWRAAERRRSDGGRDALMAPCELALGEIVAWMEAQGIRSGRRRRELHERLACMDGAFLEWWAKRSLGGA